MAIKKINNRFWTQDLSNLKYFFVVATYGGFSAAAHATGASQPALSIGLKKLELSIGKNLILRKGRSIELTSEGARLMKFCLELQKEFTSVSAATDEEDPALIQNLRLGSAISIGVRPLAPVISKLNAHSREMRISVDNTFDLVRQLKAEELDMALLASGSAYSGIVNEELCSGDLVFVVGRGLGKPGKRKKGDILRLPFPLITYPKDTPMGIDVDRICLKNSLHFDTEVITNSIEGMIELVKKNIGGAFVFKPLIKEEIFNGELKSLDLVAEPMRTGIQVCFRDNLDPKLHRDILRWLRQ